MEKYEKLMRVFKIGQLITSELGLNRLFEVIVEQTNDLMETERCSIFLIDDKKKYLKPFVSKDLKQKKFMLPKGKGVAGWVYSNKTLLVVHNAYQDQRFCSRADEVTGFYTRMILCEPLIGRNKDCFGTMQLLNKKSGPFTEEDQELIAFISGFVSIAIENSLLYEEIKESDRAKTKAISHLSHELKTPLAIIATAFERIEAVTRDQDKIKIAKPIKRGKRNVTRLVDLQYKVEDILGQKTIDERTNYLTIIEEMKDFIEEVEEETSAPGRKIVAQLNQRLNSILQVNEITMETINLEAFLNKIIASISSKYLEREISIQTNVEKKISIWMDKSIFYTVCEGLLKNAIENTPNNGVVHLIAGNNDENVFVTIKDHGIGISRINKKNIFKGLFHTQETKAYSSKNPYQFNAGGAGMDLLRIKILAERHGFSIDFESARCRFLPLDENVCPGNISLCNHISNRDECLSSGGSSFTLVFPKDNIQK